MIRADSIISAALCGATSPLPVLIDTIKGGADFSKRTK